MSQEQLAQGLSRLRELAADFELGERDLDRLCYPLRREGKLVARVSQEILEDMPATPGLERVLTSGLEVARHESKAQAPRIVSITTTGAEYE